MKIQRIIICLLFFQLTFIYSCKTDERILFTLKYEIKDSCNYYCNNVKVLVKNNTNDKLYLMHPGIKTKNMFNLKIGYWKSEKMRFVYFRKARKAGNDLKICYSPCHIDTIFINDARKQMLPIFRKYNNFSILDTVLIKEIESWMNIKYDNKFIIEPYQECLLFVETIDYYWSKYKKIKIQGIYNFKNKKGKDCNITLPDGRPVKLQHFLLPEVAGYKLFTGKAKSNTLVIKNGKLIKDKPARGHSKKNQNK